MDLMTQVEDYIRYIRRNQYIYSLQKQGIELFRKFLAQKTVYNKAGQLSQKLIDYFLLVWVPKSKKYLTEDQAYNVVYTMHDMYRYFEKKKNYEIEVECPIILEQYGEEYMRLYKTRRMISELSGDPVLRAEPLVISLQAYRQYKQKKRDMMSTYEQGVFVVEEINREGYIGLINVRNNKYYKVLFRPRYLTNFRKGDILHITIKKRLFFVYWELDEIKTSYLSEAIKYLKE